MSRARAPGNQGDATVQADVVVYLMANHSFNLLPKPIITKHP